MLQYPWLPLTNNEAERALRHWVIARRVSYGTRTPQGSRAFALLASVIETCRKRQLAAGFNHELMRAVHQAREGPGADLARTYATRLAAFKTLCEQYRDSPHEKTRALAREFLNDWEAMWVVLQYPWLPLTNNEAERALRHWVIARRVSYGTRTPQGSRAFAPPALGGPCVCIRSGRGDGSSLSKCWATRSRAG